MERIGISVNAFVHDCGTGNIGVWKDAGVNHETQQTPIQHLVSEKEIFCFLDALTEIVWKLATES